MNDRNLVEYLPPFLAEYKEINAALTAENPEFKISWDAAEQTLKNEFISTADEYGIKRFEKLLKIFPSADDTLESRRSRVLSRWFAEIPYTERVLISKLISLCGESNFTLKTDYERYTLEIETSLNLFGQVEELQFMLDELVPANMVTVSRNVLERTAEGTVFVGAGTVVSSYVFIETTINSNYTLNGTVRNGGAVTTHITRVIKDERQE
ncbi:MAG: DUF2313 domain-containing protein [Oscillospiraceae bacterium]|nr:DUF2313 domain-containing protein [Oscillospiraceae bacterium]